MNRNSAIRTFLLRFDFNKKVIFILTVSILTALFLLLNILLTYFDLTRLLQRQLTGLQYHNRTMAIFETVVNYQSKSNDDRTESKARLEARLLNAQTLFSFLVEDLKNKIKDIDLENAPFYLKRMTEQAEKFHTDISAIRQNKLNTDLNTPEEMRNLKNHLLSFLDIIDDVFELHLYTNHDIGQQFDYLLNRLPSYQNALSDLLSINFNHLTLDIQAKLRANQLLIEKNLNALSAASQFVFENNEKSPKKKNPLEMFLNAATYVSNALNSKLDQPDALKAFGQDFQKMGLRAMHRSYEFYRVLSANLNQSLTEELREYHYRELVSTLLFFLGTFVILTPYLTQAFRRPLGELKTAIEKLTDGDLSVRIPIIYPNEVGAVSQSFNETAAVFEQIMHETNHFAKNLSRSASEIFSSAKKLEKNLGIQELTVQAITQNSKNILQTVQEFSQRLVLVNNTIRHTAGQVELSQNSLKELEAIMQQMASSAVNAVTALSSIKSEINKITLIINTLINIADQINLLSINTAIRASKMGLKTLGYTVIADKIREIADQTAYATLDVEQIVQQILSVMPEIMLSIDQFGHEIQGALDDSIVIREQFQQLLTITQMQIASFQKIDQGMQDQVQETSDIDKAIDSIVHSTHQTTRSVQSLSTDIEYLHHSTKSLLSMTKKFTKTSKQ